MLTDENLRFAIDDARRRHSAVLDLIYHIEKQSTGLLGLYTTLGIASASGFVASLSATLPIPRAAGCALLGATIVLLVGAWKCGMAMKPAQINLPGRNARFWLWANEPQIDAKAVFNEYLTALQNGYELNTKVSNVSSIDLKDAKSCGLYAPLIALLVGIAAFAMGA